MKLLDALGATPVSRARLRAQQPQQLHSPAAAVLALDAGDQAKRQVIDAEVTEEPEDCPAGGTFADRDAEADPPAPGQPGAWAWQEQGDEHQCKGERRAAGHTPRNARRAPCWENNRPPGAFCRAVGEALPPGRTRR